MLDTIPTRPYAAAPAPSLPPVKYELILMRGTEAITIIPDLPQQPALAVDLAGFVWGEGAEYEVVAYPQKIDLFQNRKPGHVAYLESFQDTRYGYFTEILKKLATLWNFGEMHGYLQRGTHFTLYSHAEGAWTKIGEIAWQDKAEPFPTPQKPN